MNTKKVEILDLYDLDLKFKILKLTSYFFPYNHYIDLQNKLKKLVILIFLEHMNFQRERHKCFIKHKML